MLSLGRCVRIELKCQDTQLVSAWSIAWWCAGNSPSPICWNCVSRQVLCLRIYPKTQQLKTFINLDSFKSQESESSFAGWLCLKISHKISVKLLARAVISERGGCHLLLSSPMWPLAEAFNLSSCGPLQRAAHNMTYPRARQKIQPFYNVMLQMTHRHFCHYLLEGSH